MKRSDMVPLKESVFQLERGHVQWNAEQCEAAVIAFVGCETELDPKKFKEDEEVL